MACQMRVGRLYVRHDDRQMLKPAIVAAAARGVRRTRRPETHKGHLLRTKMQNGFPGLAGAQRFFYGRLQALDRHQPEAKRVPVETDCTVQIRHHAANPLNAQDAGPPSGRCQHGRTSQNGRSANHADIRCLM
jgi:hypothetical protein